MLFPLVGKYRRDERFEDARRNNHPSIVEVSLTGEDIKVAYIFPSNRRPSRLSLETMMIYFEREGWQRVDTSS